MMEGKTVGSFLHDVVSVKLARDVEHGGWYVDLFIRLPNGRICLIDSVVMREMPAEEASDFVPTRFFITNEEMEDGVVGALCKSGFLPPSKPAPASELSDAVNTHRAMADRAAFAEDMCRRLLDMLVQKPWAIVASGDRLVEVLPFSGRPEKCGLPKSSI